MPPRQLIALLWLPLALTEFLRPSPGSLDVWPTRPAGPAVQVTPADSSITATEHATGYVATFFVKNVGTVNSTYTLSCVGGTQVSCVSYGPSQVTLSPNQQVDVDVTFATGTQAGPPSQRILRLIATGGGVDTGRYSVTIAPSIVQLAATGNLTSTLLTVRRRQPLVIARFVLPAGLTTDTASTVLRWRSGGVSDTVTKFARHNRGLLEWEVDSTHQLSPGGSADSLIVRHCAGLICTTESRRVLLVNDSTPLFGFTGMPLEVLGGGFRSRFGPGLSVSGAEVETGFSTPAYVSMGLARSAGLVYSTRTSYPRAVVNVDLELTWPTSANADTITLTLRDANGALDTLNLATPNTLCDTGGVKRCRATLQADYAGTSFPKPIRRWLYVDARIRRGATIKTGTDSVEVTIVDRRTTPYGSGWWPVGLLRLDSAGSDRLLVGANGSAAIFRGNGDSVYIPPMGSFTNLVKTAAGWELRRPNTSMKTAFTTQGLMLKTVDANGNRDSLTYIGSSDTLSAVLDPMGKSIGFTYTSGRLSKITTLSGGAARELFITITADSGLLKACRFPWTVSADTTLRDSIMFRYRGLPGNGTVALTQRIGLILDTTTVIYDTTGFKWRPIQAVLPRVPIETGDSTLPIIRYTPYESRGYDSLLSLSSAWVEMKDPNNHWTRSLQTRWGQATKTWDTLGNLAQSSYTPDGFLQWTQPATIDSNRITVVYDARKRPVKTYALRRNGIQLRLDSLVYDAADRVVKLIDPRGQSDSLTYDANGNIIARRDAAGNTIRFWYKADGRMDSLLLPGAPRARQFNYESTWGNLASIAVEDGSTAAAYTYDSYGRLTVGQSKVRVKETGSSFTWQWRRQRNFYRPGNQLDSTLLERTNNCANPCSTPSGWPADNDWTRRQRIRTVPDRAGRDSARKNGYDTTAVVYLYDRLGRLRVRRAKTGQATTADDSIRYDVAGNLRRTRTRRGDTISTWYDSRNRDTLSIIQGVGHLHKAYSGTLSMLDSAWYTSASDPIGGVNGRVNWSYDSRGRMINETVFTGSLGRGTTFSYDIDERDSTYKDTLGVWSVQYEILRNIPNVLMSPLGDTLTYYYDQLRRPQELIVSNGGAGIIRAAIWNGVGEVTTLMNNVGGAGAYLAGRYSRVASVDEGTGPDLGPRWNGLRAAGVGLDSLVDSLTFDGWERLIEWRQRYKVPPDTIGILTTETYSFDREGNITTPSGAEFYEKATSRLLSKTDGTGTTWSYAYDTAGNLTTADSPSPGTDWTYAYDTLNRLTAVTWRGTLVARYGYDVLGRRIAKRVYSTITGGDTAYTRFVYHGNQVAYETDSAGSAGLRYTWGLGIDDLVGLKDGGGNRYTTVQDPLHNVRGLVAANGSWKMSQRFSPYGTLLARDSAGVIPHLRYQWTGREHDSETGLFYFRTRYYDPNFKRFISEDRAGYTGSSNLYGYTDGRVTQARDPFGMDFLTVCEAYLNITWRYVDFFGYVPVNSWITYENCMTIYVEATGGGGGGGRARSGERSPREEALPVASDTCPTIIYDRIVIQEINWNFTETLVQKHEVMSWVMPPGFDGTQLRSVLRPTNCTYPSPELMNCPTTPVPAEGSIHSHALTGAADLGRQWAPDSIPLVDLQPDSAAGALTIVVTRDSVHTQAGVGSPRQSCPRP